MAHKLFDIWYEPNITGGSWRAQMVNYIGYFLTREYAESYVEAVKKVCAEETKSIKNA